MDPVSIEKGTCAGERQSKDGTRRKRTVGIFALLVAVILYVCSRDTPLAAVTWGSTYNSENGDQTTFSQICAWRMLLGSSGSGESAAGGGVFEKRDSEETEEPQRDDSETATKEDKSEATESVDEKDAQETGSQVSSTSDSETNETEESKPKPVYDLPGVRFVFALFGLILLNMLAICVHHVYQKITRSQKLYRNFEDEKSPF
ncbi:uncharacterized protein LODBEIA_P16480 [Lodderomyces beijingensis]|uniref:Uncharacterized protein n=1 Tax=Lodderomyces beijingensis TaxID=1775926 RepID=A0ABP0ZGY8_9ASCO